MKPRVLKLLEYDKIRDQLAAKASSSLGREIASHLEPSTDPEEVRSLIEETDEALNVLRLKGHLPFGGITDVRPPLKRAQVGGVLSAKELMAVADTIRGSRIIKHFIEEQIEDGAALPILGSHAEMLEPAGEVEREIRGCIDDQGYVMDSASDALRSIRSQLRSFDGRIKDKLESIVRSPNTQKMLSEAIVTIRNNRHVVPVKQEYRQAFGGIVHDQSASGATFFIEPQAIVELNNRLNETRLKEEQEVDRILTELSRRLAEVAETVRNDVDRLAVIDFIFAKARLAETMKATKPALSHEGTFHLKKARHPLIPLTQVVPIDVALENGTKALVITGPNTGGKTVTLKTVGLLTLMAQSGLHLPVYEGSVVNVFEHVFADIGDEQSIEQSLSTFSSHMKNIIAILEEVNDRSLVLFDELGAGTDPQEGAALSISILDEVRNRGACLIATTHYSELKAYAYEREGVINASVEFDVATLSPTYRLLMGIPGRSNAFEISKRLGLDERIIEQARSLISSDTAKVDDMIASLERHRLEAERANAEAARLKQEWEKKAQLLDQELAKWEREKDQLRKEAEREAKVKLAEAKEEAESIIKKLREMQTEANRVKEHELIDAKSRLDHALDALQSETSARPHSYSQKKALEFEPGQEVKVTTFGQKGHIIERLSDKEYLVQVGVMKMNIAADSLKPVKEEQQVKPVVNVRTQTGTVRTELDLRGERYEEAMERLDKYLDAALLAGYPSVSIIHGKGTGALRKGVQTRLSKHPRIKSIRLGGMNEGGHGVTVVEFK
ncbi:endonuclease MutS2 [Pullulanibacillus sp. KACC 23026]|uniref:endonuclease MutS2 n=1 Tax=Pullulanibacillus sp. KACC 23026 TaxID=3028315 RepID=UPI0023B1CDD2|nr:endonuclease MutS2 [Pullulanibacillus sp. KACC 23026]WEG13935.1 endonuclease MutS2 [Pullulanibacillus sp. KACC 23026]